MCDLFSARGPPAGGDKLCAQRARGRGALPRMRICDPPPPVAIAAPQHNVVSTMYVERGMRDQDK